MVRRGLPDTLLGYVTQEEEDEYERSRQFVATRVAWRQNDYGKIATGLNYMLRHDRSLDRLMDSRAMVEAYASDHRGNCSNAITFPYLS